MTHWVETYMPKKEFEQHISDEWMDPEYKGEEGPIEINNREDSSLKIVLVNTRNTARRNRISLEIEEDEGVEELEAHSYGLSREDFGNVIEWLEHFCQNSSNYL